VLGARGRRLGSFRGPASQIPRITPEFLAQERRALGESWFRQEYCCSFEALEGLVYHDFARCVVPQLPAPLSGQKVGGIDFGFRNPFAAVWGTLDRDDILWLTAEHYARGKPLNHHAQVLPRDVMRYADPAGAGEREELLCAGFRVRQGKNAVRPGIAAVSARLESGTLRILKSACPNLLSEAELYRYDDDTAAGPETPLSVYNHALDALRYLIPTLDARRLARPHGPSADDPPVVPKPRPSGVSPWSDLDDPMWSRIF
jgi:Terminase RNaseH-like domain